MHQLKHVQEAMLTKGSIHLVHAKGSQFLRKFFLVPKKDGGSSPVISLRALNSFIPYSHFKMEGFHLLKDLLGENDFMSNVDLKDVYFASLCTGIIKNFFDFNGRKTFTGSCVYVLVWVQHLRFLKKLLKIPIAILRRIQIRIILYLDDMLLMIL